MFRYYIKLIIAVFSLSYGQVDYSSDIQTIFTNKCGGCHISNSSAGLNLSSYENTMSGSSNEQVVIPYDHVNSSIYDRITRSESESGDMPPTGSLTQAEIDLIAQWIDEGALEEAGSSVGCTDPQAYNCADDDGNNYTFEVGIDYVNGCNYELDDYSEIYYAGGCEDGPCDGYYNPGATTDDGSCDYYQAPTSDDVEFIVYADGINIDWSNFIPPPYADVIGYIIQRCTSSCVFITGSPFPWPNGSGIGYTQSSFFDSFDWQESLENCNNDDCPNGQIKYAIDVHYSNAESYGMAIGASYIAPNSCPALLGDLNGDSGWNVLDIVALANCVLSQSCPDQPNGCAGDMNGDGGYNVLDIVALANCVLSQSCEN